MQDPAAYKVAAINWLLANGTSKGMTHSTDSALADLSVRGVDYEDSETPDFQMVAVDDGDSFNRATYAEAFSTTVYPLDRDKTNWREGYTFHIGEDALKRVLISQVILGVLAAAEGGDEAWKAKADQREIERIEGYRAREAERERLLIEARAVKATKKAAKDAAQA